MEDLARSIRIRPDVELGGRGDVADRAGGSAHDHAALHAMDDLGRLGDRQGDVGERSQGDQGDIRASAQGLDQEVDRAAVSRSAVCLVADVTQPVPAVEPEGVGRLTQERSICAGEDRGLGAAQLDRVESVVHALLDRNVARHDRDTNHLRVGVAQRHDQRHRIVRGRVGVDQEPARHGKSEFSPLREPGGSESRDGWTRPLPRRGSLGCRCGARPRPACHLEPRAPSRGAART